MSIEKLRRPMPLLWEEQRKMLLQGSCASL